MQKDEEVMYIIGFIDLKLRLINNKRTFQSYKTSLNEQLRRNSTFDRILRGPLVFDRIIRVGARF